MPDTKPRVPGQGKAGPATAKGWQVDSANGRSGPAASDVQIGMTPRGTSGRKTWPKLSK